MTEEAFQIKPQDHSWLERLVSSSFEHCGCLCEERYSDEPGTGPHDDWRHPIGMPLVTFSILVGLAPEGWSVMAKDSWREGKRAFSVVQAVSFFCIWLLSGVGLLVFIALFFLTTPLRWLTSSAIFRTRGYKERDVQHDPTSR